MATVCSVCNHPDRARIDELLVVGRSWRSLSGEFGGSKDAYGRHARAHLGQVDVGPAKRSRAAAGKRLSRRRPRSRDPVVVSTSADVEARLAELLSAALGALESAELKNDNREILAAVREAKDVLVQIGRAKGMFAEGGFTIDARRQEINLGAHFRPEQLLELSRLLDELAPTPTVAALSPAPEVIEHAAD